MTEMLPQKIIGIEQVNDKQVEHTTADYHPVFALAVFALLTAVALIVTEVTK